MFTGNKREWVLFLKLVIPPCGVHGRSPSFQSLGSGRCKWWGRGCGKHPVLCKRWMRTGWDQEGRENLHQLRATPRRPWVIYGHSPEEVRIMPQTGDLPVRNGQFCHGDSWTWIASVHTDSKQTLQLPLRPPTVAVPDTYPLRAQGPSGSSQVFVCPAPSLTATIAKPSLDFWTICSTNTLPPREALWKQKRILCQVSEIDAWLNHTAPN